MTSFEDLFNRSVLSVITPEASLGFPVQNEPSSWANWLAQLEAEGADRKTAFFDENLDFILTLRFEQSAYNSEVNPRRPPLELLQYLAHLQVSYDASYISSIAEGLSGYGLDPTRPPVPPRSHSMPARNKQTPLAPPHPSIFPPHTPHPIPSTADADKQYVQAQGTLLRTGIWGEGSLDASTESFALLWSASSYSWVAVFRMSVQVAFIPTKLSDPLLCLTVSTTLREKPVTTTQAREPLIALLRVAEEDCSISSPISPMNKTPTDDAEDDLAGLEEVNLLEGLTLGPTFSTSQSTLSLPSTRLGSSIRRQVYSLPPSSSTTSSPMTSTPSSSRIGASHQTLRKSFRKTLRTVSGFRVRMRTVFVPFFLLPQSLRKSSGNSRAEGDPHGDPVDNEDESDPDHLYERELREAGTEENTVVLCVEVENGGESDAGFSVESVSVTVSGEGAQTHLIGWGEVGFLEPDKVFPILLGPHEQYNLLYAVAFMRSPEMDEFSLGRSRALPGATPIQEMQRAVAIIISGRPYEVSSELLQRTGESVALSSSILTYPTHTFPSRWNCVLDLSPQAPSFKDTEEPEQRNALPTPASPFPMPTNRARPTSATFGQSTPRPATPVSGRNTPVTAIAGSKRHTLSAMDTGLQRSPTSSPKHRSLASPVNYRSGTSLLNPANHRDSLVQSISQQSLPVTPNVSGTSGMNAQNRSSYLPPSITAKAFAGSGARTPMTTYAPTSPPPMPPSISRSHSYGHVQEDSISTHLSIDTNIVPPTPAYPAFPTSPPPSTPHYQGPIASFQSGPVGPSVEIRREKGSSAAGIPPTPGPRVPAAGAFAQFQSQSDSLRDVVNADGPGEPIIVSVGLLSRFDDDHSGGREKIYPLDKFTLDIFVFNRSSWTRRFEISHPDRRKLRKEQMLADGVPMSKEAGSTPGILPLENRIRVGPLLPSTCQSVRMDFIALAPGVHSIDMLTLTDIQSGFVMNLRSVMDIVVYGI